MIKIRCNTNIDRYQKEKWPSECPVVPREGDYIQSEAGIDLKVVRVTYTFEHIIRIELHTFDGKIPTY